jgi:signal transduction histidine kinase
MISYLSITILDNLIYKIFYYIKIFLLILLITSFFIPYKYGVIVSILMIILVLTLLLITAFQKFIEKYKPAKYYLLAILLLIMGAIIYAFKTLGLLPAHLFTEYTFQIGSLSQAILLSLGLAYRIDLMRIENKNLNTNLELQIKETNILYKNLQNEIIEKAFLQKSNDEIQLEYSDAKANLEKAKEKSKSLQEIMLQSEKKLETVKKELEEAFFQLIQAEKLSTIGTMVAGIAHDINNPLNFMSGANYNLSKTLKDFKDTLFGMVGENTDEDSIQAKNEFQTRFEKFQKFIDDINLGINRITEISKSMRNATRTDKELSKDVSFSEVCEEAIIITSSKLKNVELIREFSSDFPYLTCNRSQMSQVIMNFLSNSADAIEEYKINHPEYKGKIKIFLRSSREKISFGVEDNGGGIMKEAREKVMKAFYTTKPTGVGTGLCLAICGKIIESHGWKISIDDGMENKNGYGAKFEVICSDN